MSSLRRKNTDVAAVTANRMHVQPQPMDVMLGRGKSYRKNPGNIEFQALVTRYRLRYSESTISDKRDIVLGILRTIQARGNFLKFKDASWTVVSDETARQKIAHAIQYQIRNESSTPKIVDSVASKVSIPAARRSNLSRSFHEPQISNTHNQNRASIARQRTLRTPRPVPPSQPKTEPQHVTSNKRGFSNETRLIPPPIDEAAYQQWLFEQAEDYRSISAIEDAVLGNTKQSRSKMTDRSDPYFQHSNRSAVDHIDFSQQLEYVGSRYSNSQNTINAMAYDLYSDHRHLIEQNYNRTISSFQCHIDNLPIHQPFGGVLLNDGKLPAPPAPVVHSLDVSGVSQWDGSVDFLENGESVDVKKDSTSGNNLSHDSHPNKEMVHEINFKYQPQRVEPLESYPNCNAFAHAQPALHNHSTETGVLPPQHRQQQQQPPPPPPLTDTILHQPQYTTTMTATINKDVMLSVPSPMESLLRAASDFSRDDSFGA